MNINDNLDNLDNIENLMGTLFNLCEQRKVEQAFDMLDNLPQDQANDVLEESDLFANSDTDTLTDVKALDLKATLSLLTIYIRGTVAQRKEARAYCSTR